MRCYSDIHHGVWAGHRFGIVSLADLKNAGEADEKDTDWKDISVEVAESLYDIWNTASASVIDD